MQIAEVRMLMATMHIAPSELMETHISWVLLSDEFAYKIRKPVRFSFLDFTTLDQRLADCRNEVELNRRLTDDMYLGILPVYKTQNSITLDESIGEVIDYAVHMRRLPRERQMDVMLQKGIVTPAHMIQIAEKLAAFHKAADIPSKKPDINVMKNDFADLGKHTEVIRSRFGADRAQYIPEAIAKATTFLDTHENRIVERHTLGFVRDGHGDLHSKNIFLLDQPVIFDCLEFNAHLRHVDVLDELAFFCLDLELFGAKDLANTFLQQYLSLNPCVRTSEDKQLFRYFQLYRAGVKLKINLIKASDPSKSEEHEQRWKNTDDYFRIFQQYLSALEDVHDSDGELKIERHKAIQFGVDTTLEP